MHLAVGAFHFATEDNQLLRIRRLAPPVVAVLATMTLPIPIAAPAAGAGACHATMSSTFLQPSVPVFSWSGARYDAELAAMSRIGIRTVIDQWTVDMDANLAHYRAPASWYPRGANMVDNLLYAAGRNEMSVWLGLGNAYDWQSHATDYAWLSNQLYVNMRTADQLYALHPGKIRGWYISNEVDDLLLSTPEAVAPMRWFFTSLANYLHTHNGNLPVMASPTYSGLRQSPAQFAASVKGVLGALDVVNVQDGGGSGYIGPSDIGNWFSAISSAFAGSRTALWSNADMYGSTGRPMDPARLQANLNATCGYVAAWSGFSYSTQMAPSYVGTPYYYDAYGQYYRSAA